MEAVPTVAIKDAGTLAFRQPLEVVASAVAFQ
jgi:hypothetical protein